MGCIINLAINGLDNIELANNIDESVISNSQSKLDIAARSAEQAYRNEDKFNEVKNALTQLILGLGYASSSYDQQSYYVPNYSPVEFMETFGEKFGFDSVSLDYIPEVLVILPTINNGTTALMMDRVVEILDKDKYKKGFYIVPLSEMPRFALHLKALLAIDLLLKFNGTKTEARSTEDIEKFGDFHARANKIRRKVLAYFKQENIDKITEIQTKTKIAICSLLKLYLESKFTSLAKTRLLRLETAKNEYIQVINKAPQAKDLTKLNAAIAKLNDTIDNVNEILDLIIYAAALSEYYIKDLLNLDLNQQETINNLQETISLIKTNISNVFSSLSSISNNLNNLNYTGNEEVEEAQKSIKKIELLSQEQFNNQLDEISSNSSFKNAQLLRAQIGILKNQKLLDKIKSLFNINIDNEKIKPFNESFSNLFNFVLTNKNEAEKLLPTDFYYEIRDFLYTLTDKRSKMNNKNVIVDVLNGILALTSSVSKALLKKQLNNISGLNLHILTDEQLFNALDTLFIQLQYQYQWYYRKGNNIVFVKKRVPFLAESLLSSEEFQILSNTSYAIKPYAVWDDDKKHKIPDTYLGEYIYVYYDSSEPKKIRKWFSSPQIVWSLSDERIDLQSFNTRLELLLHIEAKQYKINLSTQSSILFLHNNVSGEELLTIQQYNPFEYYKPGLLLSVLKYNIPEDLDIPKSFPETFTVTMYENWMSNTFRLQDVNTIKSLILTPDLKALFYKVFRHYINQNYSSDYNMKINRVIEEATKINGAGYDYYIVTLGSHKIFHNVYFQAQKIDDFELKYEDDSKRLSYSEKIKIPIVLWTKILKIFLNNGINMVLLQQDEVPEQYQDAKAYTQNGIIYINLAKATFDSPFHEYTHILLGILLQMNPDVYLNLLQSYYTIQLSSKKWTDKYKSKFNAYRTAPGYEGLSNDALLIIITEEMFADDYGAYLRFNMMDINDIFHTASDKIIESTIFDQSVKEKDFFQCANSKFDIFTTLSQQIRNSKTNLRYGFVLNEDHWNKIKDVTLSSEDFDNLENQSDGLYQKCE